MPRDVMPLWQDAALARQMNAGEGGPLLLPQPTPQANPFIEKDIAREMMLALGAKQEYGVPTILELGGARFGEAAERGPHGMIRTTELGGDIPEGRIGATAAAHYRTWPGDIEFKEKYGPEGAKKESFPEIARHETMHSLVRELGESGALMEMSLPEMEDIYKTRVDRGMWSGIKPFSIDPSTGLPANYMPQEDMQQVEDWKKEQEEIRALMVNFPEWADEKGVEAGAQRTRILRRLNRGAQLQLDRLQEQIDSITPASMEEMRDPAWVQGEARKEWLKLIEKFPESMREDAMEQIPFEESSWGEENWAWKTPAGDRWTVEDLYNLQQMQQRGAYADGKFVPPKPTGTKEEDPVGWINWEQFLAEQPPASFGGTPENYAEAGLPVTEGMGNWPMSAGHFFTLQQSLDDGPQYNDYTGEGFYTKQAQQNIEKAKQAPKGSFVRAIAQTGITEEALRVMRNYLMDNDWDREGLRDYQESLDWYMENIAQWTN